jgi:ABC-type transport system involved in multi-copper enzyme maturation permease subunit
MVAGGLRRVGAVAANTFRETVRERVLYNLVFFAVLMTLSGLLLGELSIRQDEKIIKNVGLASMDIFGTLIAVFIGVGLVSKEIERRSLYPLLAKPLSREEFLLGKFVGLGFTLLVNLGVMTLGLYLTLLATGRSIDWSLLKAIYAILLSLLLTVALALLFSTMTSSTLAAVFTVCTVVAGRFSDVVRNLRDVTAAVPEWLVRAVYLVIPNFLNFDIKDHVIYGDPIGMSLLSRLTLYTVSYAAVVLGLAMLRFRGRDLT